MKKSKGVALLLFGMLVAQCIPLTAGASETLGQGCENKITANFMITPYTGNLGKQVNLINWDFVPPSNSRIKLKTCQLERRVNNGDWEHLGNISKRTDFVDRNITETGTYQYRLKVDGDSLQGAANVNKLTRFTNLKIKTKSFANKLIQKWF